MGAFTAYSFSAGIVMLAGYLVYKWLLSTENQPGFNRIIILAIYAMSFILPLCNIQLASGGLSNVTITGFSPMAIATETPAIATWRILLWTYLTGIVISASFTLFTLIRLLQLVASGTRTHIGGCILVVIDREDISPFSWAHYIVVSRSEETETLGLIIRHERAHIRLRHFYDLLLAQLACILQWYNPAAWLMLSELKAVHEYQADHAVLREGTNIHQYQTLLIKKTVGGRFQSLANSLNHSNLKKRITMMYKTKSKPVRRIRALAAVPAAALALALLNVPSISEAMTALSSTRLTDKVNGFSTNSQTAEKQEYVSYHNSDETIEVMPEYPGGMPALFDALATSVRYPEDALKAQIEGKVIVGLTIDSDGHMSDATIIQGVDPQLDAEALRAITAALGAVTWTPGKKDGKPVKCTMACPVDFKLK